MERRMISLRARAMGWLYLPLLSLVIVGANATWAEAQESPEPVLDQLRDALSQPGFTVGLLLQAVLDAGLDAEPASAQVAAARLLVSGRLDGDFNYLLQTNFAGSPSLLDARVGWSPHSTFAIHAGRFKAPFSRELLTFAGELDFASRSRVVDALAPNRQMGVQMSGGLNEHVSWAVGGFTGGSNSTPNESLAGVARIEADGLEFGGGTVGVAGHVAVGRDGAIGTAVNGASYVGDGTLLGVEGRFVRGRLLLEGEFIRGDWDPAGLPKTDADGLYLTGGWMVAPDQQGLVRWDRFRAPGGSADDMLVVGYNVWPTTASQIRVNWHVPLRDSGAAYKVLVGFQIGF